MLKVWVVSILVLAFHSSVFASLKDEIVTARRSMKGPVTNKPSTALKKAQEVNLPVLCFVFDKRHKSGGDFGLHVRSFLKRDSIKEKIARNFVQGIFEKRQKGIAEHIPEDDPPERCRVMVITPDGEVLLNEPITRNPETADKYINRAIEKWERSRAQRSNWKYRRKAWYRARIAKTL